MLFAMVKMDLISRVHCASFVIMVPKLKYYILHILQLFLICHNCIGDSCLKILITEFFFHINLLTPNDDYSGFTALLTSKCCILYIYSTNIGTEYFKHSIYSPIFPLQNAVCFINLTYLVPVLFTFYIQCVLKLKKIIPVPKG